MRRAGWMARAALMGLALAAAGCKREPPPPEDNVTADEPAAPAPAPAPVETPAAPAPEAATNLVLTPPDSNEPSADQQTREDAEATGMTSRSARGDTPPDEAVPASENTQK